MSQDKLQTKTLMGPLAILAAGILVGFAALLLAGYQINPLSFPAVWWRDHPFNFGNILFLKTSISPAARLWAYDPLHLFGWIPNAFYNPLATLAASLWVGVGGGTEAAYRLWLIVVLVVTSMVFLVWLPRQSSKTAWISGGLVAALGSLLVYPMDVGLLDVNPVQVLYTGQWPQRLGVALGLLALQRFWQALGQDQSAQVARRAWTAAALLGTCLFTHYMSGYAAAGVMTLMTLWQLLAGRLTSGTWRFKILWVLPATLLVMMLLFADFFYVLLAVNRSHHNLGFLRWQVPEGALTSVQHVVLAALPLLVLPLLRTLTLGKRSPKSWYQAAFPLLVLVATYGSESTSLLFWFFFLFAASLVAAWLDGRPRPIHWLPVSGMFLLLLACGPTSLQPFGLDLSMLVPFSDSLGWAKLAGFSRFLFFGWFGVLVTEELSFKTGIPYGRLWAARLQAGFLTLTALALPLGLSVDTDRKASRAQSFFGWMTQTDRTSTRALLARMREVALRTPRDGYLLVEDTLHHPKGSNLDIGGIPHGHLPYLVGPTMKRPVLGGAVTTRLLTHPLAHTSRGQLLCQDFTDLLHHPGLAIDRLRSLGISDILVHSPELLGALKRHPAAVLMDNRNGLAHFMLEHYRPVLTNGEGLYLADSQIYWRVDALELRLPEGTQAANLLLVWYPFLDCMARGPSGSRACKLSVWRDQALRLDGCRMESPQSIQVDVPWIRLELSPDSKGPVRIRISSRPPLAPFLIMLAAWTVTLAWRWGQWKRWLSPKGKSA